jgi:hypothetical protein
MRRGAGGSGGGRYRLILPRSLMVIRQWDGNTAPAQYSTRVACTCEVESDERRAHGTLP